MACGDVIAEIDYLQRLEIYQREKPFQLYIPIEPHATDQRYTNIDFETRVHQIVDLRGNETKYGLDSHGFEFRQYPTSLNLSEFQQRTVVEARYLDEMEQLLKTIDGGIDRVFFFDWRIRSSQVLDQEQLDMNDLTAWLKPASRAHVDQSPRGVVHRIQLQLQEDAEFLLQGRVRVLNIWRPIDHQVEDYPLAVCDSTSVPYSDLVETDHVRRKFKGSNFYSYYNPAHKWYYLSEQTPNEVLLMKMFDSDSTVKGQKCLHASFKHPTCPKNALPRLSIETRALVFNYAIDAEVRYARGCDSFGVPESSD